MAGNSKKRKLCVLIPTHWEALMGGSQYQAKILIEHLIETGKYDIYYLTKRIKPEFMPNGYRIIQIPGPRWIRRFGFFFDTRHLLHILNQIKPDIIYQRVGCAYTGIAAYYAKHNGCKMIWHIANDNSFYPIKKGISPSLFFRYVDKIFLEYGIKNTTYIIAQTEHQRRLLQQAYDILPTVKIPNFHPLPQKDIYKKYPLKVLWVANFKSSKRPEIFIQLARDFQNISDIEFIMIGAPASNKRFQNILEDQIIELKNLKYFGKCSQETVNQMMAEAHIFVSTARHEGFANTFIQAWMHKVPVVSLDVSPDGLLNNGFLGYVADNYEALVKKVKLLLSNALLRKMIGCRAQEYAYRNFSHKNVEKLAQFIDQC